MRSISFAASSLRSRSPPTLKLIAQARAKARQTAADKAAGGSGQWGEAPCRSPSCCQRGDIEPGSASPVRILSSLDQGRQPARPQHTSPSLSCGRPVIVGTEWYKSPVAGKLAAFTELANGAAETPALAQCVKTKWKPTPNSAPDGSYARRRQFDRNAPGLPPARSITDLP